MAIRRTTLAAEHDDLAVVEGEAKRRGVSLALVLVEVDYWVMKLLVVQAWQVFVEDVAGGAYRLEALVPRGPDPCRRARA